MKKKILILVMCLLLLSMASAAENTIFTSSDGKIKITASGSYNVQGGKLETVELPAGSMQKRTDFTVYCGDRCKLNVKKSKKLLGTLQLNNVKINIPASGKYEGVIKEIEADESQMSLDEKSVQIINGMKMEMAVGTVLDFWFGEIAPKKAYDETYFNDLLYKIVPTTKPKASEDKDGKVVYDEKFKKNNLKVPNQVHTSFREGGKKVDLKICDQLFNDVVALKTYGSSDSANVRTDPNTLSGRKVISEEKSEIKIKKDENEESNCLPYEYTLSSGGKNFCGILFYAPKNMHCEMKEEDKKFVSILECKEESCKGGVEATIVTELTSLENLRKTVYNKDSSLDFSFDENNPFNKIITTQGQNIIGSIIDFATETDIKSPKGLVFYNNNDKVRVIGVNKISQLMSPATYRWYGGGIWSHRTVAEGMEAGLIKGTRGGYNPTEIYAWQAPQFKEEKVIKIEVKDKAYTSLFLRGGTVSIGKNFEIGKSMPQFILSNKYLYLPKSDARTQFPGYEIKIVGKEIFEISKAWSNAEDVLKLKEVNIRELKANLRPPILAGVQEQEPTGGEAIKSNTVPSYIILEPLKVNEKLSDSKPLFIYYDAKYGETLDSIASKFGPGVCDSMPEKDGEFKQRIRSLNKGLPASDSESIVKKQGQIKRLKVPASGSTFYRKDVSNELKVITCVAASKNLIRNKIAARKPKATDNSQACSRLGGNCMQNYAASAPSYSAGQTCTFADKNGFKVGKFKKGLCTATTKVNQYGKSVSLERGSDEYMKYQCCVPTESLELSPELSRRLKIALTDAARQAGANIDSVKVPVSANKPPRLSQDLEKRLKIALEDAAKRANIPVQITSINQMGSAPRLPLEEEKNLKAALTGVNVEAKGFIKVKQSTQATTETGDALLTALESAISNAGQPVSVNLVVVSSKALDEATKRLLKDLFENTARDTGQPITVSGITS